MKQSAVVTLVCLLIPLFSRGGASDEPFETLQYRYGDDRIFLTLNSASKGTVHVEHVPFDPHGKRYGKAGRAKFDIKEGPNTLILTPAPATAHRLKLAMDKQRRFFFVNRGSWYLDGPGSNNAIEERAIDISGSAAATDLLLATGCTVKVGRLDVSGPVTVGRTLGPDDGFGVVLEKTQKSLVIEAKGSVGPTTVSVAERLDAATVRYYDYPLLLDTSVRRYDIPLVKFHPREGSTAVIRSIHAVSIRTEDPVKAGDSITVTRLALSRGTPYISEIVHRRREAPKVRMANITRYGGNLFVRDTAGMVSSIPVTGAVTTIPKESDAVWYCGDNGTGGCDPPDAPSTAYGIAGVQDRPLVIDTFDSPLSVNRFRLPTTVFAATREMEKQLTRERGDGVLRITYYPVDETDHAGYLTPLPKGAGSDYKTLAVTLRGSLPPNFLQVGIKDQAGREARIPVISYWSGDATAANPLFDFKDMNPAEVVDSEGFRTVTFPIDAFRAVFYNVFEGHAELDDVSGISFTMNYGGPDLFHEIELRRVALIPEPVPIVITAFDNEDYGINSLGGVNFSEERNADIFDVRFNADGFYGKGLRTEVSLPGENAYGLVAFGFGKLDAGDYSTLSFSVRGEFGGEDGDIYLNDGKCRAKVPISTYSAVTRMWRTVKIPLLDFRNSGVDLTRLTQLILVWEGKYISRQVIYFDNFIFE